MRSNYKNLFDNCGIQKVNVMPDRFTPTYVLGEVNNQSITVSDMLDQIKYTVRFIKANFNVDQEKYKETLVFLNLCQLRLQNQSTRQPTKQMAHFVVAVFHEIKDAHAKNDDMKRENEKISIALDMLIDKFIYE